MSEQPFDGQHVVVTGGGSGIGREAALAFAAQGAASVVITGRRAEPLAEVADRHPAVVPVVADVTTEAGAESVAEAITDRGGRLDVLVHNAGVYGAEPLDLVQPATVRNQIEVNVVGPVLLTARLLPLLRSPGGNIVVVSSISGRQASPGSSVYGATKAAVDSLIRSWAIELGPRGIRVNGVAPGMVRTPILTAGGIAPQDVERLRTTYAEQVAVGRVGEVDDVVPWITRLAEPASSWVTGEIIVVDGGRSAA
ncbi:SDR family NAD(P)-dependent oxidoreductase [Nocardia asteroides]